MEILILSTSISVILSKVQPLIGHAPELESLRSLLFLAFDSYGPVLRTFCSHLIFKMCYVRLMGSWSTDLSIN